MTSKLIPELLCTRCLRYFSKWEHLEKDVNIKFSLPNLRRHQKHCNLLFKNPIFDSGSLRVYCIAPNTSQKERVQCGHIAETMWRSEEVPGDLIGWYATKKLNTDPGYAFVPVLESKVTGLAIVRNHKVHSSSKNSSTEIEPGQNWCAEKIWIHEPYRRNHIATKMMHSIANYFHHRISDLWFLGPFTDCGEALVRSLSPRNAKVLE